MEKHSHIATVCLTLFLGVCVCLGQVSAQSCQLDDTWTVSVNGQTVSVSPQGTFRIPNVSAADQWGEGGPGTAPDFFSDDFVRVIGTKTIGGETCYAFSEPFKFFQNQTYRVPNMTITTSPPPSPVSMSISPGQSAVQTGDSMQLTVMGMLPDGSMEDVTPATKWTTYRTSNPNVAMVDQDGVITATGNFGTAIITAVNEGATATARVSVIQPIPETTVIGFTLRSDGTPVVGATVTVVGSGESAVSNANGLFQIPDVLSGSAITLNATTAGMDPLVGFANNVETVTNGFTDAGLIYMVGGPAFFATGSTATSGGQGSTTVLMDTDIDTGGWSFGLCSDPVELDIFAAALGSDAGTSNNGAPPGFAAIDIFDEGVVVGIVVDLFGINSVPSGAGYRVLNADFDVLAAAGIQSDLCFCNIVNGVPVDIVVSDTIGNAFPADDFCGTITVVAP